MVETHNRRKYRNIQTIMQSQFKKIFVQANPLHMRYHKSKQFFFCNFLKLCVFLIRTYFFRQLFDQLHKFVIKLLKIIVIMSSVKMFPYVNGFFFVGNSLLQWTLQMHYSSSILCPSWNCWGCPLVWDFINIILKSFLWDRRIKFIKISYC